MKKLRQNLLDPTWPWLPMMIALGWRALFWPVSDGAYTDGILAIDTFRFGLSYWPPLFALEARCLAWIPGVDLEGAGRLVALLAGALILWPLAALARRLFGARAAGWTMAAWILSPIATRWSLQVMTDIPMLALWTAALAGIALAAEAAHPGLFASDGGTPEPPADMRVALRWLLLANMAAALATLTRYQGILLAPPLALAAWRLGRTRRLPMALTLLPWLAVALWLARQGPGPLLDHLAQFRQRAGAGGDLGTTALNYWQLGESFVMAAPYFFTYGIFGFAVYGLLRVQWATVRLRWAGWVALWLVLAVLALQSAFQSFQERYLAPLLPVVCLLAGHGLAVWQRRCARSRWRFWLVAGPALGHALLMTVLVAAWQGRPFAEFKRAAQLAGLHADGTDAVIYTNEMYNETVDARVGPPKAIFWSGHPVRRLPPDLAGLRPGDLVILSSWYAGPPEAYVQKTELLAQRLPASILGRFDRTAIPLLPDLMAHLVPVGLNQNPLALGFRYQPQPFQTAVLQVTGEREIGPAPPPMADPDPERADRLRELETMQQQIERERKP